MHDDHNDEGPPARGRWSYEVSDEFRYKCIGVGVLSIIAVLAKVALLG